ncbi:MAG: Ig-like domain-containing protein [Patescibacteria group bacterium]
MRDQKQSIWNQRLPSFLGVLVLLVSITTILWLSRNAVLFGTQAAISNTPQKLQISNITDTSFTVSYITEAKVIGALAYGQDASFGTVSQDDRDKTGTPTEHRVHSMIVSSLTPGTTYFFAIASGTETFLDQGKPYTVTTARTAGTNNADALMAKGKVTLADGSLPLEGIAYVFTPESQLLSGIIQPDGSYSIPLGTLRTKDLAGFVAITPQANLSLIATNGTEESTVSVLGDQIDPIPPVVLSKTYDFALDDTNDNEATIAATTEITAFPTVEDTAEAKPQIIAPREDAELRDPQPIFRGKALPNETVTITIQSDPITVTVTADETGSWEFRPEAPIEPGEHTVTIETKSDVGLLETITNSFTVFAEGSEFIEPSVEPSISPTKAPTATPTQQPSPSPLPTKVITPSPTQQITQGPTVQPTAGPTVVPAGSSAVITGVAVTGFLATIGMLLFFFAIG